MLYQSSTENYQPKEAQNDVIASLRQTHTLFSGLRQRVDQSPIARAAKAMSAEAQSVGGQMVVNIRPDALEVWRALDATNWWCFSGHMVVPAVAGLVQVRSIEPKSIEVQCLPPGVLPTQGFGADQEAHRTDNFTPAQLCALGRPLNARKVYSLMSYKNLSSNRVINFQ